MACLNLQRLSKKTFLAMLPSYYDTTYVMDTITEEKVRIDSLYIGPISKIQILKGGNGYSSTPEVLIYGGNGSGATAEAVMIGNSVSRINITNAGEGYTKAPYVTISGGGGYGAVAVAYIKDLTNILKNGIYKGRYKRIEKSYPRNILLENDNWEIKSFNPRTREVCIAINKNVKYRNVNGVCPKNPADNSYSSCPHGLESISTILSYTIPSVF